MPTGRSIAEIYGRLDERGRLEGTIPRWGDAVVWSELHHSEPYRMDWGCPDTLFVLYALFLSCGSCWAIGLNRPLSAVLGRLMALWTDLHNPVVRCSVGVLHAPVRSAPSRT